MTYKAPIEDIMFNIEHLSSWAEVTELETYSDITSQDAEAVLDGFGRFCSETIAELTSIGDTIGSKFDGEKVILPDEFKTAYDQFVEMGWQSLPHSTSHGGMGLPRALGAAATEILNSSDMSFGLCPLLTDGAVDALMLAGSKAQKDLYLEKLISGRWTGTMNLTEPQAGSDLGRVRTKAVKNDDGTYAVSGTKIYITYGEHELSENIIHLVLARTPDAPSGPKGLSLFIVPKFVLDDDGNPGERNGVNCISIEHKLGIKASPTAVLEYDNATGYLIGEENHGLQYMFIMMMSARFLVGIQGVAISERAYQHALAYAKDREQSPPVDRSSNQAVTIAQHPDVRRMLLRMRALVEGGRALSIATAGWLDLAKNGSDEQSNSAKPIAEFLVPLVKSFCTERALEVTSLGVQIHGGMGFIEETGVAQFYRDARILPIYEGTTAIQANDLLGRKILRDKGALAEEFTSLIKETESQLQTGSEQAKMFANKLAKAREAFQSSLNWLIGQAEEDINATYAGSVPILMLAGNLAAGWQLGKSILAAEAEIDQENNIAFSEEKIATACFYAQHILPECELEKTRITEGADSILSAAFAHLET